MSGKASKDVPVEGAPGALQAHALPAGALELTKQLEQEKIESLQGRVLVLCKEKDFLKKRLEKAEKDAHENCHYFQVQIEGKDAAIHRLQEEVQRAEIEAKQSNREAKDAAMEEVRKSREEMEAAKLDLGAQLHAAVEEARQLGHFKEIKDGVEGQLRAMEAEIEALKAANITNLNNQERKFLAEKAKMQKEMEERTEEIRRVARLEAQAGLDSETKKIVADNRRMGEELRFQLQMMSELQLENAKSGELVRALRRELSIFSEKEKEFAAQGSARSAENKKLVGKVMALEEALLNGAKKFKDDRDKIKDTVAKELEEATLDAKGLRQLVALKNKELSHVKKLAQTILDQRGEVEQFFLESIEQVKVKIVEEREVKHRRALVEYNKRMREATAAAGKGGAEEGGGGTQFPSIRGRALPYTLDDEPSALPQAPSKKVDIATLGWEDRERVLRLLFAKINNVQGVVEANPSHRLEQMGQRMPEPPPSSGGSHGFSRGGSRPEIV